MTTLPNEPHPLGTLRKSYFPRPVPGKVMLGSAIFCAAISVLEFITALSKYLGPPNKVLSDRYRQDAILIAAILALIFFLLAILLGALYYAHKKHRVDLYESGIVITTWRNSTAFPWYNTDDFQVMPIYGRSRKPINWDCTLTRDDGVKAQFRGLEGLESLIKTIEHEMIS
ncbi:MAG: hypothetical protein HN413_05615 [Chloroflexi bacterium]|jgi:hypothetical protein|nr:hypothetical protein [Chloroflexota bacterium]